MKKSAICSCFFLMGCIAFAGCNSPEEQVAAQSDADAARSLLNNALTQLREEKPSVAGYLNAVKQINSYLERPVQPVEFKLDSELRTRLVEDWLLRVPDSARRLRQLDGANFTDVDASYLDSCFLMHDAAHALLRDLGPLPPATDEARWNEFNQRLAAHVFEWTMRHVQLTPRSGGSDVWPAHQILRRGMGDAEERLRVYLGLLDQLNLFGTEERRLAQIATQLGTEIDAERRAQLEKEQAELRDNIRKYKIEAGLISRQVGYRDDDGQTKTRAVPWVAAVLIGGELYLFDANLGRPLHGQDGKGIATWKQIKANPSLLEANYAGTGETILPGQLAQAEMLVYCDLAGLAPRMRWLEEQFETEAVILHQDPLGRLRHLEELEPGLPVRFWNKAGNPGFPLVVLNEYVEHPQREMKLREELVPRKLTPDWARDLANQLPSPIEVRRLFGPFDNLFLRTRLEPGGVRDLLVRGRPEEAVQRILDQERTIDQAMQIYNRDLSPVPQLQRDWIPKMIATSQQIQRLQQQARALPPEQQEPVLIQLNNEIGKLQMLWKDRAQILSQLSVIWAIPEYRAHLTYFMALAKMDLARRAELQAKMKENQEWPEDRQTPEQLWQAAEGWLQRYYSVVLPHGIDPWRSAVDRQLQVCREELRKYAAK